MPHVIPDDYHEGAKEFDVEKRSLCETKCHQDFPSAESQNNNNNTGSNQESQSLNCPIDLKCANENSNHDLIAIRMSKEVRYNNFLKSYKKSADTICSIGANFIEREALLVNNQVHDIEKKFSTQIQQGKLRKYTNGYDSSPNLKKSKIHQLDCEHSNNSSNSSPSFHSEQSRDCKRMRQEVIRNDITEIDEGKMEQEKQTIWENAKRMKKMAKLLIQIEYLQDQLYFEMNGSDTTI
jgi:hypothetical protein